MLKECEIHRRMRPLSTNCLPKDIRDALSDRRAVRQQIFVNAPNRREFRQRSDETDFVGDVQLRAINRPFNERHRDRCTNALNYIKCNAFQPSFRRRS